MEKKLVARIQKLAKKLSQAGREFSLTIATEPDEQDLVEKKGFVYCVFDVQSEVEIDPLLISKVIHDVLYDTYYGSESASPIQSLERAIVDVKEKVVHLPGLSDSSGSAVKDFNLLAVVFWGNVLYMVQFGRGGSFLVRDGVVKPVNSATEGSFSVASGVVKDGDVVILGTEDFIRTYTPEDLVSGNISFSMHDLQDTAAALLLKFDLVDEEPKISTIENKPEPTIALATKAPGELPKINLTKVKRKPNPPLIVGSIAVLLLVLSIVFSLRGGNSEPTQVEQSQEEVQSAQDEQSAIPDTSKDAELKIERVDPAVFYDIKLVDTNASPSDITVLDSDVVVSDSTSGKLFSSSLTTSKFEEIGSYAGIKNIGYFGGDLVFTDNEGYKVWDGTSISESYTGAVSGPTAPYLAYLYEATAGKVVKYSFGTGALESSDWATSTDFDNPTSIAVDGNIYVLNAGGISKWYAGEKVAFEIIGLDKPISSGSKIIKTLDLENIYVADRGNQRVLILDAEGALVKQILSHNEKFNDIKAIGISPDESQLFVLNGSKVYAVGL